jgi:hypothetical protein
LGHDSQGSRTRHARLFTWDGKNNGRPGMTETPMKCFLLARLDGEQAELDHQRIAVSDSKRATETIAVSAARFLLCC